MLCCIPLCITRFRCWVLGNFFFCHGARAAICQGPLVFEASQSHSDTPHSVDPSGRVISPTQRPLLDTQHSQGKVIHALGGIRTGSSSKRPTADPRLRPRGHWDWLLNSILLSLCNTFSVCTNFL